MDLHVKTILLPNEGLVRDFAVFVGVDSCGKSVRCAGYFPGLSVGMPVRINGTYQLYTDSGSGYEFLEIKADSFSIQKFTSTAEIRQFLLGLNVSGCGPKTIDKIIAAYGLDTVHEIMDTPDRFAAVSIPGVGEQVRKSIRDDVTEVIGIHEAYSFLIKAGFPDKQASNLADRFGRKTERVFNTDPYSFTLSCPEIPVEMIDNILVKNGRYYAASADRIASAIMYKLRQDTAAGHVFSLESEVLSFVTKLSGLSENITGSFRNAYRDAVGKLHVSHQAEISGKGYLYQADMRRIEGSVSSLLYAIHRNPAQNPYSSPMQLFRQEIALSPEQKKAVWNVFEKPLSIITGGPGTGKSFITKIIYEAAENAGLLCKAAAPTGRAARRLDNAIFDGHEVDDSKRPETLHRLLKATGSEGKFLMNSGNRLPYDLFIIDESSMIDICLARSFLEAVSPRARIVFIGDENQLPPVGPGNFFADMIASGCVPVTRLSKIYRQDNASGIVINADRVNAGEFPLCAGKFGLQNDDFFFFECGSAQEGSRMLPGVINELSERFGFDPVKDIQILTPTNVGNSGTGKINAMLREKLNPKTYSFQSDYAIGERTFRPGDKVMQTSNNYSLMVYNGDIGYISGIEHDIISVDFPDYGRTVSFSRNQARDLTLAYAVTIHKAQGSETEAAVVVMDRSNSANAVRKQLYTAVTRARKVVVLIGEREAFRNALANKKAVRRNTELTELIRTKFTI